MGAKFNPLFEIGSYELLQLRPKFLENFGSGNFSKIYLLLFIQKFTDVHESSASDKFYKKTTEIYSKTHAFCHNIRIFKSLSDSYELCICNFNTLPFLNC